jgi:hypothetical protein
MRIIPDSKNVLLETDPYGRAQIRIGGYAIMQKSGSAQNSPLIFANEQFPTKV